MAVSFPNSKYKLINIANLKMTGYVCKYCGFRTETKVDSCPYCDKKGMEREKDAEELLNSIEGQ